MLEAVAKYRKEREGLRNDLRHTPSLINREAGEVDKGTTNKNGLP